MGVNNAPDSPTNDVSARVQLHLHNRTSNIVPAEQSATTSKTLQPSNSSTQHPLTERRCLHENYLTDIHTIHIQSPCANTSSTPKSPSARPAARSGSTAPRATRKKKTTPSCRASRWSSSARSARKPSARTRASSKTGASTHPLYIPPSTPHQNRDIQMLTVDAFL
jgi:hypothetical protein